MPARRKFCTSAISVGKSIIYCAPFLIAATIFLFCQKEVLAQNLLSNSDFEIGVTEPWESSGGGATATISSELVHSGAYSLRVQHDKTSSYGFQETIKDLEGGMFYEVAGFGATKDSNTSNYFLRVAWYESADGSGSQLPSPMDTEKGERVDGEWIGFTRIVQAPINARSAKVRLVLTSKINGVVAFANFDDIVFQESIAPTPTPTPTSTPPSTPTPEPTNTPTPTPKPSTPTPTKKPSPTSTPAGEILGEEESSPGAFYPWEATEEGEESQEATPSKREVLPLILVGLGLASLGGAAYWVWYTQLRFSGEDSRSQ